MDKELRKRVKNIKKIDGLIQKNKFYIDQILVSELFLRQLMEVAEHVDVKIVEDKNEVEVLYLFGKPVNISKFINEGCILMLTNEEYIVLKSI